MLNNEPYAFIFTDGIWVSVALTAHQPIVGSIHSSVITMHKKTTTTMTGVCV